MIDACIIYIQSIIVLLERNRPTVTFKNPNAKIDKQISIVLLFFHQNKQQSSFYPSRIYTELVFI